MPWRCFCERLGRLTMTTGAGAVLPFPFWTVVVLEGFLVVSAALAVSTSGP